MENTQTIGSVQLLELAKNWKLKKKPTRVSKLEEHKSTIKYLRSARHFSAMQIHKFLKENGVKISYPSVNNFVNRKK